MATEANGSIGGHGHQQQRSFAKSISKHTALQIRQSATATVKACSEQVSGVGISKRRGRFEMLVQLISRRILFLYYGFGCALSMWHSLSTMCVWRL